MGLLKEFTEKDIPEYIEEINSTNAKFLLQLAGTGYEFPLTTDQIKRNIGDTNHLLFKFENNTGAIIGYCQLTRIDWQSKTASVGRVLIKNDYRGRGFSSLMINQLLLHATNQLNLRKLSLRVFDFNKPAINSYTKIGFKEINREEKFFKEINETWGCITMEKNLS